MADAWRVRPDWLLSSAAGTSCGPVERFKGVRAHSRQGQVHRRGFHQMRHTFASVLINAGSSLRESRSMGIGSIEPAQRRHFSTTWPRLRVLMKSW